VVVSGFPCERFVFEGFLPHKKGRKKHLNNIAAYEQTCVLYESPHRLLKTLTELQEIIGDEKPICVCKELTKIHESIYRGTIKEVMEALNKKNVKGEIVIVIGTKYRKL